MMMKFGVIVVLSLFYVEVTKCQLPNEHKEKILNSINRFRSLFGAMFASDMMKLEFDSKLMIDTHTCQVIASPNTKLEYGIARDTMEKGLMNFINVLTGYGKEYIEDTTCASDNCKQFKAFVYAKATKINCIYETCPSGGHNDVQYFKCILYPEYNNEPTAYTAGKECSACGVGYKCEWSLCVKESGNSSACRKGGNEKVNQNILLSFALLFSLSFI